MGENKKSGVGSFIGGVVSQTAPGLISSALSNYASFKASEEQRAWQEKMWHMQNDYNDPSAMANRMRAAGLNPFTMMGAEPAGSAGTGSTAATTPVALGDPLAALKTIAEVENLSVATGKTETETEKLLKEIANLDVLIARGLISNEEYRAEVDAKLEAWKKRNPEDVRLDNVESSTAANTAAAAKSSADAQYTASVTATENALRDLRVKSQKLSNDEISQRISNLKQEHRLLSEQIESMSRDNAVSSAYKVIGNFYGMETISNLPPALIAKASEYYQDFMRGEYTYQSTIDAFYKIINLYNERAIHIVTSSSQAESASLSAFGVSTNHSYSVSASE